MRNLTRRALAPVIVAAWVCAFAVPASAQEAPSEPPPDPLDAEVVDVEPTDPASDPVEPAPSDVQATPVETTETAEAVESTSSEPASAEPQSSEPTSAEPEIGAEVGATDVPAPEPETDSEPASATLAPAANPGTAPTTTGQNLTITIDTPTNGSTVGVPAGTTVVSGRVTLGTLGLGINVVYIVDVSGSTSSDAGDCNGDGVEDAGDDLNGDGSPGEIIDCEIAGVLAINGQLAGTGVDTGVIPFASSASAQDVDPAQAGDQGFTTPDADRDGSGTGDIEEVVRSLDSGGGTDFDDALQALADLVATQPAGEQTIVYFFTDGFGNLDPDGPLAALPSNVQVNTFAVGTGASTCESDEDIRTIADATNGTCREVADPTQLSQIAADLKPTGIDRVLVSINGGPPIEADLDLLGNWSVQVTGLIIGPNSIVATAVADDGTQASADVTVFGVGPEVGGVAEEAPVQPASVDAATTDVEPVAGTLPRTGGSGAAQLALSGLALTLSGLLLVAGRRLWDVALR